MSKMQNETIKEFRGDYSFLSNFHPCRCYLNGVRYPTVEHAYQAAKFVASDSAASRKANRQIRKQIRECATPGQAKKLARRLGSQVWGNWRQNNDPDYLRNTMRMLVWQKFHPHMNPALSDKLAATGNAQIIEGNWWGDKRWGVCLKTGEGDNWLGRILMDTRTALRSFE